MAEEQKEKKVPSYVAIRFADKTVKKDGVDTQAKRQVNLFYHGGNDKGGNPILSNDDSIAFVNGRNIAIFPTDKEGKIKLNAEGKQVDPIRRNLESIVGGAKQGLDSKGLNVGEATIVGPEKEKLVAFFSAAIAADAKVRAEKAAAQPASDSPAP